MKKQQGWQARMIRILAYATVYLILNLIMQLVLRVVVELADSQALRKLEYRNYLLVALNMLLTASLYGGILSNLEGGLEKITLQLLSGIHKISRSFLGFGVALLLMYYFIFAAYYWNLFGKNILPQFLVQFWQSILHYLNV